MTNNRFFNIDNHDDHNRGDDFRFEFDPYNTSNNSRQSPRAQNQHRISREFNRRSFARQGYPREQRNAEYDQPSRSFGNNSSSFYESSRFDDRLPDYDQYGARGGGSYEEFTDPGIRRQPDHSGKGPRGWKRSDERIRDEVCHRLERDPRVDASDIDVHVENGIVTLSGSIDDREAKWNAVRVTEMSPGVRDVNTSVSIKSGDEHDEKNRFRSSAAS